MSRNAPFDEHVARGLLKVIGQAGQLLDKTREATPEVSHESSSENADKVSSPRAPQRAVPPSPPAAPQETLQGDVAARRLFALMERANEGEAGEPPAAESPSVESPPVEPPPVEPTPAELPPVEPTPGDPHSAKRQGGRVPAPQRRPAATLWRRCVTDPNTREEDAARVIAWLETLLAETRQESDDPPRNTDVG